MDGEEFEEEPIDESSLLDTPLPLFIDGISDHSILLQTEYDDKCRPDNQDGLGTEYGGIRMPNDIIVIDNNDKRNVDSPKIWDEVCVSSEEEEMYEMAAAQPIEGETNILESSRSPWTTVPIIYDLISGIEPRLMNPKEFGRLVFHSAIWSLDTYLNVTAQRNLARRYRERALIKSSAESAKLRLLSNSLPHVPQNIPPSSSSSFYPTLIQTSSSTNTPIIVSVSSFAAARLRVTWSCRHVNENDCFEIEVCLKEQPMIPLQFVRLSGRKFETCFNAISPATSCVITVRRLEYTQMKEKSHSSGGGGGGGSGGDNNNNNKDDDDEDVANEWVVAQETSIDIITPATQNVEWLNPSAPVAGSLLLTLFWEDCPHVSHWCVKCCDLRDCVSAGRSVALGAIKTTDSSPFSSPSPKYKGYSLGDSWRWKPVFSSLVHDNPNYVENDIRPSGGGGSLSYLGTCAQVISFERIRGTVKLRIDLGEAGGGTPVDDNAVFAFLVSGFVPSSSKNQSQQNSSKSLSSAIIYNQEEEGEWCMSTRSLSLACDPTAQIPKRRAVDLPKNKDVQNDASLAALIAATSRLAVRGALAFATGIATGGPVYAVIDVAGAGAGAALGRLGAHLRTTELTNGTGLSLLAMGCGLELGSGAAWRGLAADSLLNDIAHACRHGELDHGDCDFAKATLQTEGLCATLSLLLNLLHRRQSKESSPNIPSSFVRNNVLSSQPNEPITAEVSLPMAEAIFPSSLGAYRADTLQEAFSEALVAVEFLESQVDKHALSEEEGDIEEEDGVIINSVPGGEVKNSTNLNDGDLGSNDMSPRVVLNTSELRGEIAAMECFNEEELKVVREAFHKEHIEEELVENDDMIGLNIVDVDYEDSVVSDVRSSSNPNHFKFTNLIEIYPPNVSFEMKTSQENHHELVALASEEEEEEEEEEEVEENFEEPVIPNEFSAISDYLMSTLSSVEVVQIWRNENMALWNEHLSYTQTLMNSNDNMNTISTNAQTSSNDDNDESDCPFNFESLKFDVLHSDYDDSRFLNDLKFSHHRRWLWHGTGVIDPRLLCSSGLVKSSLQTSSNSIPQCFSKSASYFDSLNMTHKSSTISSTSTFSSVPALNQSFLSVRNGETMSETSVNVNHCDDDETFELILSLVVHNTYDESKTPKLAVSPRTTSSPHETGSSIDVVTYDGRQAYPAYIVRYKYVC